MEKQKKTFGKIKILKLLVLSQMRLFPC